MQCDWKYWHKMFYVLIKMFFSQCRFNSNVFRYNYYYILSKISTLLEEISVPGIARIFKNLFLNGIKIPSSASAFPSIFISFWCLLVSISELKKYHKNVVSGENIFLPLFSILALSFSLLYAWYMMIKISFYPSLYIHI